MKLKRWTILLLGWLGVTASLRAERPNVVIMIADDAGWGDYSSSGNESVRTPHIDSLARDGVRLDRYFVQPACAPTRAELLTGRCALRSGVGGVSGGNERIDPAEKTIADCFRSAGYATGIFGKWHNGAQWPYVPAARGFEESRCFMHGQGETYYDEVFEDERGTQVKSRGYIDEVSTQNAIEFIRRHRDEPFFCVLPFALPHKPWIVKPKDWARWKDRKIPQDGNRPNQEDKDATRAAMAMLENQDANVGCVLEALDALGLEENTVVIYFSDNGPNEWRWNGAMKGIKGWAEEGGVRSICHVRYPAAFPSGRTVEEITSVLDWLPTLTALAEIPRVGDRPLDGRNILPLLTGEMEGPWPDRNLYCWWHGGASVRTQHYRLGSDGGLYDMRGDPLQTTDIAAQEPERAAGLKRALEAWKSQMPLFQPGYEKPPFGVGYPEFPITRLDASEGIGRGGIPRSGAAPNNSWFDWEHPDREIYWPVEVQTAGRYHVQIDYTCPEEDVGSLIEVSFKTCALTNRLSVAHDPPCIDDDTVPRSRRISGYKEFREWDFGVMDLPAGRDALRIRALEVPGDSVMDVRRITLTLMPR
ncbi:sulfatase-like hydrolase/transferase [Kiritimatiella glycovorans]|uniref:Arylsulfatase n=1 Tax=Kiritimatiella glycovorans TaxID=1307763 RepID=A0A0G3ECF9_9BACT|nr:sulfatase-like hydrolase/transferase [Kiritimatiella glycovorans]AKJ64196.1 Arylsulfatase precursor [Kiritimatiella glycovorans]